MISIIDTIPPNFIYYFYISLKPYFGTFILGTNILITEKLVQILNYKFKKNVKLIY